MTGLDRMSGFDGPPLFVADHSAHESRLLRSSAAIVPATTIKLSLGSRALAFAATALAALALCFGITTAILGNLSANSSSRRRDKSRQQQSLSASREAQDER